MAAQTNEPDGLDDQAVLYHQLDTYPWDQDQEFQGGLRAILGSVDNPSQVEHLTLRAKCYYYTRKAGVAVDFEGYKRHAEAQKRHEPGDATNGALYLDEELDYAAGGNLAGASNNPDQGSTNDYGDGGLGEMANAPRPASFAEICALIAEGKPIPGIKDIPDTVLEGQKSEQNKEVRLKPWERGTTAGSDRLSWMESKTD